MPQNNHFLRRSLRILTSRPVGALAGGTLVLIFLGCMSLSFGGLSIGCRTEPDGTVCQEGKVELHPGQSLDVYYPAPYASPPNLELTGDTDKCEILEQHADHFRLVSRGTSNACPQWHARGLRGGFVSPAVLVPSPPATVPPPNDDKPIPLPAPTPLRTTSAKPAE
jgi:hypothetical protein